LTTDYSGTVKTLELRTGAFAPGKRVLLADEWIEIIFGEFLHYFQLQPLRRRLNRKYQNLSSSSSATEEWVKPPSSRGT
jgi:hypothetical protein